MTLRLTPQQHGTLDGQNGAAAQWALELVVQAARIMEAGSLVPITFAHIDACFYTGLSHIDFVRHLLALEARLSVPTWTNNSVASPANAMPVSTNGAAMEQGAHTLMRLYQELGCTPTWTCAPYHLPGNPGFGQHIAVGESNAVAFYNSVIGARTNKYGDYLDVACAITGLAPCAGLHTAAGRRADLHIACGDLPASWRQEPVFFHLLGHIVGRLSGQRIPVISGLPPTTTRDHLKALCAAAAAAGGVELLHVVGVTPEAPDLAAVGNPGETISLQRHHVMAARTELQPLESESLDAVALGTPHFSLSEFGAVVNYLEGRTVKLPMFISTSRGVREMLLAKGWLALLQQAGITIPVDICTYYTPGLAALRGTVMTDAAKWAYYAPGMLGVQVVFGSLRECVESAVAGRLWRDPALWGPS